MKYRQLGRCGLKVSELAFGAGNFGSHSDEKASLESMAAAYDAGIIYFDNAQSYNEGRAEEIMGRALKTLAWPRIKFIVATKYFGGMSDGPNQRRTLNRKFLLDGIDGSLQRLQLDYVDLIYCHRADPDTPIEETVWAMHNIIERGKALYWGTSNWTAEQLRTAWAIAERHHLHKPVVEQPQYNLLHRKTVKREYPRLCADIGLGLVGYSPLAGGLLTGKYRHGVPQGSRASDRNLPWMEASLAGKQRNEIAGALEVIAQDLGCPLAHLSIAWCLTNPDISSTILGASRPAQIVDNVKALEVVPKLTPEVMARIESAVGDYSVGWTPNSVL